MVSRCDIGRFVTGVTPTVVAGGSAFASTGVSLRPQEHASRAAARANSALYLAMPSPKRRETHCLYHAIRRSRNNVFAAAPDHILEQVVVDNARCEDDA